MGDKDHLPLLFGAHPAEGLVAAELDEQDTGADRVLLFTRGAGGVTRTSEPFEGMLLADAGVLAGVSPAGAIEDLAGSGRLNRLVRFDSWKSAQALKSALADATGFKPGDAQAPYLWLNDPIQQHFIMTGRTLFRQMAFEEVRRMQVDIECTTSEGYDFCNAEREGDRLIAIAMADSTGWLQVLSAPELDEKEMLRQFVACVRERDPDVIEGHNLFNFDLPYLSERARRHRVKLEIGRDGRRPVRRASRFNVGERTLAYDRFDIHGRHVVDTMFMAHAYDVTHRSLNGFGLKEVARHFGVAAKDRTYIDGGDIRRVYETDPKRLLAYVSDDVRETRSLADLLSRSLYVQAQMLPYSYQNTCVRGNATKIDALMLREYIRRRLAVPLPELPRVYAGGYTDLWVRGLVQNVHHCDVRSLYPSLMLTRRLGPRSDGAGVFLEMLSVLRTFRLEAKAQMRKSRTPAERQHFDALQTTFKVLINSFYGYLGFSQGHFNDFNAAERVTADGRALLSGMLEWLRAHGATPVEVDTDGVYFVPPEGATGPALDRFREQFAASLPEGIELEFDGEYRSMFSYRMKNYALLAENGEMVIKGAALKSRGLEPFQRRFMEEWLRLRLEGRDDGIPALKEKYSAAIRNREWDVAQLAKTETLQDSLATYQSKRAKSNRARSAAYELALASGREYRAGDTVSYYVTGEKKSVAVHEHARLVKDWKPGERDENVPYYLAKLESLYEKLEQGGGDGVESEA